MTYKQILDIAMEQSAKDSSCERHDFLSGRNKTVISKPSDKARKYLSLPFILDITTYGTGVVASVSEEYFDIAEKYINSCPSYRLFETPGLHMLSAMLRPMGADVCFMAEYWLPSSDNIPENECAFDTRVLSATDFSELYLPEWSNALCKDRSSLDRIAVGAYDNGRLIALAGASADCEDMWQIGIDVLPEYRRMGIASCLTSTLAREIFALGKVPFYCCAWSNIASARNAIRSGFSPAWTTVTAKKLEYINKMNSDMLTQ